MRRQHGHPATGRKLVGKFYPLWHNTSGKYSNAVVWKSGCWRSREAAFIYQPAYLRALNKLMPIITAISPMNSRSTA